MFSFLCILTSIIVGLCLFFVFFGHTMFYHALMSFKKREMLTIREHLCSPSAFLMGFMWLIFLVFWAVVFCLSSFCTVCLMLPVSLNCQCCLCPWIVNVACVTGLSMLCCLCPWIVNVACVPELSMLPVSLDCQCCLCPWIVNVACVTGLSTLPVSLDCQRCLCHWIVNFSIASSIFFNIYWYRLSFSYLLVRIPFMTRCTRYNIM